MEREQIIKALECCTRGRKSNEDIPCLECPYNECNIVGGTSERQTSGTCQGWLMKDALALIKELTEENEKLKSIDISKDIVMDSLAEENAKLKQHNDSYAEIEQGYIVTGVKKVQADTVREMQERLKYTLCINNEENTEFFDYSYTLETIDEVANKILNNTEDEEK